MGSMRVKLSYTVDEEDVLRECGKLLNLASGDVQQVINLFTAVQHDLANRDEGGEPREGPVNIALVLEKIEELRGALLKIDLRASEVVEIVKGYRDYQQQEETPPESALSTPQLTPAPGDLLGSD